MKLPRSCFNDREGYCTFHLLTYHGLHHCSQTGSKCLNSKRPKDCPLVEVKSHGRVIDADAFKAYLVESLLKFITHPNYTEAKRITEDFCKDIDECPTVLEAST